MVGAYEPRTGIYSAGCRLPRSSEESIDLRSTKHIQCRASSSWIACKALTAVSLAHYTPSGSRTRPTSGSENTHLQQEEAGSRVALLVQVVSC